MLLHLIKKTAVYFTVIVFLFLLVPIKVANAQTYVCQDGSGWVNQTISVQQGKRLDGFQLSGSPANHANAHAPPNGYYFTLGRGGKAVYKYPNKVKNIAGNDINIYETTPNRGIAPLEMAQVEVSQNGTTWYLLSSLATSTAENNTGISSFDINETGLSWIQYVRITDRINPNDFTPSSDGFDIDAIRAAAMECALQVLATLTPTKTPTSTPTPLPTITLTPTNVPTNTSTPTPEPTATDMPTPTVSPTTSPLPPTITGIPISFQFDSKIANGSPLVFGGAQHPDLAHDDAWDLIANAGFTSTRTDWFIEEILPKNITLQDYIDNVNDVQNPAKWNRDWIYLTNQFNKKSQDRGMKVIGILDYMPAWLTHSGTKYGVPKDWGVYKDIVKKVYREHRGRVDYVEIWNEPSMSVFLNVTNSGLNKYEAYNKIFQTAAQAIHEVDTEINDGKIMKIIGPANDYPYDVEMLKAVVLDPVSLEHVDAVSYHNYGHSEPSKNSYQSILNGIGKPDTPIFITEWNYSHNMSVPNPYNTGALGISYTGAKLVNFLKQGIGGANYFLLNQASTEGYAGIYLRVNGGSRLLPQARSWQVLSKTLGLGAGTSEIFAADNVAGLVSAGFSNVGGNKGIIMVNTTDTVKTMQVTLPNAGFVPSAFKVYYANLTTDGKTLVSRIPYNETGTIVDVPAHTVVGILFE